MKIAFLTSEYPHKKTGNSGGIGTSIKNLAKGLLSLGCEVLVLVYGQDTDAVFYDDNICVQQIKNVKFKGLSWYLTRKKIEKIINNLHADSKIDILEVPDWTGISSFIAPKKCPVVIKLNGSDTYFCNLENRKSKWINRFHEKRAIQNADFHVAVSAFTARETNRIFGQNIDYQIIPNAINAKDFEATNATLSNAENARILYFGSLIRKKGLLELPMIFNELVKINPKVELVLVGKDVPDIASGNTSTWEMMQLLFTEQARSKTNYRGALPYSDMKDAIQNCDVCVFPSFIEAFPVSWLEAMAMSKPIVASNIGWANEMIENGREGFLVHPANHIEFAEKINEILKEESLKEALVLNAKNKVLNLFDTKIIAGKNLDFYKSIVNNS